MTLDQVRVVGGIRRHRQDAAGRGLEGDDRPALPLQQPPRQRLQPGTDSEHEVVARHGRPPQLVERRPEDGVEVRVRAGEEVVVGTLEAGAVARLRRVTDDVREQGAGRIAAEVERLATDLLLDVRGEQRTPVGGVDLAALDRELRDEPDLVVLPVGEAGVRPRLPVRRADDERRKQDQSGHADVGDLSVHRSISRLARFDTSSSPASSRKFATTLEPP